MRPLFALSRLRYLSPRLGLVLFGHHIRLQQHGLEHWVKKARPIEQTEENNEADLYLLVEREHQPNRPVHERGHKIENGVQQPANVSIMPRPTRFS